MSYEIIYNKQFIKLEEEEYIPVIYAGSSNCYEWSPHGRERRERSWFSYNFICNGSYKGTKDQFLQTMDSHRNSLIREYHDGDDVYSDSRFGCFTSLAIGHSTRTTYRMWTNLVKFGIKRALTIEQLTNEGVSISLTKYVDGEVVSKQIYNESDLIHDKAGYTVRLDMTEWKHKYLMKKHFPRRKNY